jgi:hypothetical protein
MSLVSETDRDEGKGKGGRKNKEMSEISHWEIEQVQFQICFNNLLLCTQKL